MDLKKRARLNQFIRQNVDQNKLPQQKESSYRINRKLVESLTPWQNRVLEEESKRIAVLAGRRSGKSVFLAVALILAAGENPGTTALFISTNRDHAKRLCWGELRKLNKRFSIGLEFNDSDLIATLPNSSRIWLHGCACKADAERFRGDHYSIVAIDEAGSFPDYLDYLIRDVLSPALEDWDGPLILSGTPNGHCSGPFWERTNGSKSTWQVFKGSVLDNPAFPRWRNKEDWKAVAEAFLEKKRTDEEWLYDQLGFRREWLAEWVRDESRMVIPWDDETNTFYSLPDVEWRHIIGVDFGTVDPTAVIVACYSENDPNLYIVDSYEQSEMSYKDTCKLILDLNKTYQPVAIVGDPSPGKIFIQDLSRDYGIPIRAADKRDRSFSIEHLAQQFKAGKIKVDKRLGELQSQLKTLMWKDKAHSDLTSNAIDHGFDALRYLVTESYHNWGKLPEPPPTPEQQIAKELEDYVKTLKRRIEKDEWDEYTLFNSIDEDLEYF